MFIPYRDFSEVERDIRDKNPEVIYKYRTWEDDYHKRIITENEAWFAHPHSLNDPYDIRPPYNFVVDSINWDIARMKIRRAGRHYEPGLSDEELEREVEIRLQAIMADPITYFQRNREEYVNDRRNYDQIGLFSCCKTFSNEPMWAHYGANHCGFSVGFNTVELARALHCTVGEVNYSDAPIDYYVMGDNAKNLENEIMQKATRWSAEEELRFITVGIGITRERAAKFPSGAVSEIVFGLNTAKRVQDEIKAAAAIRFPGVPTYQVRTRQGAYGFDKVAV
ncbi:DUF2971 domain-containing protein [Chitinophaga alhagiae]|uniref:DUF2971 domain-containing protein n=1 Tax=Chitinophaga alhagiae TaxID=2203219 RepID=UPI000E5BE04B|nr:DUF2971 domain-containing protein [Chitinophaga alhagiae]